MNTPTATLHPGSTASAAQRTRRTTLGIFSALLVLLTLALLAGLSFGSTSIAPAAIAKVLAANVLPNGWVDIRSVSDAERVVVWLIRTPRVLVAALVGAGLALAGAQMQGLFKSKRSGSMKHAISISYE